ncbi:MAG: TetR family transcriptional regulator [Nitriliruptorales bacterium]|nr:TetR family transcriptional regulator [Nitriliruptorales bacterium]
MASDMLDTANLTPSQQERRQRMLAAAQELAIEGGWDAVQMRDVSERADVALGTLYRYFPSKVHLLVGVMRSATETLGRSLERRPAEGTTAAERVFEVLDRGTRALQREPKLTEAMVRALMFADATAADDVNEVTSQTTTTIIAAMNANGRTPSDDDTSVARVLEMVWLTSILSWLSGRCTTDEMTEDLTVATRLLVR